MYPQRAFTESQRTVMTAEVVTDATGFERLLGEWDDLLAASTSKNPFLMAGWMDSWRRHALRHQSLNVIVVRESGRLQALAPLMRVHAGLSLTDRLEFLATGPAGSDYLDVVVRPGAEADAIGAIADALHAQQLPLYLDHLPPASQAAKIAAELERDGWTSMPSSPDVCPFIDLSGHTWESFLDSLGRAHRANVRRRTRALAADFTVDFVLVDTQHLRRDALESLVRFSQLRWKTRGGTTAFPDSTMVAFHHAVTRRALTEGWLRLYALTLNGAIAAVMYGFAVDGRFYFYQHGYDEAYADYSPGLVLMAMTIRSAIEEGLKEFDLLYGHEPYKSLWARQQRPLSRLQLFPPRLAGTLLRRQAETRRALRVMARQLGLKDRHDHS